MALRDHILVEETVDVMGEHLRFVPLSYPDFLELQHWIAENGPDKDASQRDKAAFGADYAARCLRLALPDENLSEEEAQQVLIRLGGTTSAVVQRAMRYCGVPTEVGTATALPTS